MANSTKRENHGKSKTRLYGIWIDMRKRCDNPECTSYNSYGGQGITYDTRWKSFNLFFLDMSEGYSDELSLERKDPRKDYIKSNCEWIPLDKQNKNKKIYKSNKTGVNGTYITSNKGIETLVAHISDDGTKIAKKTWSLKKYALEDALVLARAWRDEKKRIYNYKEFHGVHNEK